MQTEFRFGETNALVLKPQNGAEAQLMKFFFNGRTSLKLKASADDTYIIESIEVQQQGSNSGTLSEYLDRHPLEART